jgi:hypothetical protein
MSYVKQAWVNDVTPVDAAHMNHIEDGIAASNIRTVERLITNAELKAGAPLLLAAGAVGKVLAPLRGVMSVIPGSVAFVGTGINLYVGWPGVSVNSSWVYTGVTFWATNGANNTTILNSDNMNWVPTSNIIGKDLQFAQTSPLVTGDGTIKLFVEYAIFAVP